MPDSYNSNAKNNSNSSYHKTTPIPTRLEILLALWNRSQWLKKIIDNPQSKVDEKSKSRVYFAQVETQIYKTILSGLPQQEIADRVKKLEDTIKNGVLIANDQTKYET